METVYFYSEGSKIEANLYLPEQQQDQTVPAVILCHGFSGIKEVLLPPYAEHLTKEGFAVLAFDYRGFGGSEGINGRLIPIEQMIDIRNAITYMQTLSNIDPERIGIWGTSFGGANAIRVAAVDERVKALVAQLTFASGRRMVIGDMDAAQLSQLKATLKKAKEREVLKNRPLRLSPDQLITDEDSKEFFSKITEQYPQLADVKIPFTLLQHIIEHNPEEDISRVTCPILIIEAEEDIVTPPGESKILFEKASEPKHLVTLPGCRHYEAYSGENFDIGIKEITDWMSQWLIPA